MNDVDIELSRYLSLQMIEHVENIKRDGGANSAHHIQKLEQTGRALYAVLTGEKPELPI